MTPGSRRSPGPSTGAGTLRFRSTGGASMEIRASSRWPADESQSNNHYAKNYAPIHERAEPAAPQITQEPGDHGAAGEGADQHSDDEIGGEDAVEADLLVHVIEGLARRRGNSRGGKQERKTGGRFAGHVAEHTRCDGD